MRRILQSSWLTLVSAMSVCGLHAQQYYNQTDSFLKSNSIWVIFPNVKYNFNTSVATSISGIGGDEGYASVADPNTGALLFYSDGGKCWNSNNAMMSNGNALSGNATGAYSTAQGVCIVPMPGQTKKYYLFSLESGIDATTPNKLYYSIVDMSLNNGLGDIVSGSKNVLLDGNSVLSEAMVTIQGNDCDLWLVLHTKTTPTFKAYHITTAGITPTPVISTTGGQIQGIATLSLAGDVPAYDQSTLTVSPDRKKLALSCMHLGSIGVFPIISSNAGRKWGGLLCDFNAATGVVSNAILTDTMPQYSAAFSPDNSKLYYTSVYTSGSNTPSRVSQITISSNDSAIIAASKAIVMPSINGGTTGKLIGMRTYRDSIFIVNPFLQSLDRINKPNLAGAACNYQSNAVSFPAAANVLGSSLPQEVVYAARPDTVRSRILDTVVCSWNHSIKLRPANQHLEDNYTWNNGTTDSTLTVSAAGTYWVKYGNSCHYRTDTLVLSGSDLNPVITANALQLSTTLAYDTYQWYRNDVLIPGAVNNIYTATNNGAYAVVVSDEECTDTSAVYNVTNATGIDDHQDLARQINIYPNPTKDVVYIHAPFTVNVQLTGIEGKIIGTIKNANMVSLADLAAGIYLLRITDKDGMTIKVEKLVREK